MTLNCSIVMGVNQGLSSFIHIIAKHWQEVQANWQLSVSRKTNTNTTTPFIYNVEYTFEQVKEAVQECTNYELVQIFDDEHDEYVLIDPWGDRDGDPFYDLQDVIDYVTNNDQVNKYLKEEFN